jgi:hypothetical protein
MPPYLAMPYFHLSKLPATTKLGLTLFCLSLSAGFVFVGLAYFPHILRMEKTSARESRQKEYGDVEAFRVHFGPHLAVRELLEKAGAPTEEIERQVEAERTSDSTRRQAFDIIHPHSFLMPVVYFILMHLMEMTALSRRLKFPLYSVSGAAMALTVFAPLIVLGAPGMAPVCFGALYAMLACFLGMALGPLYPMWFGKP